MFQMPRHSAKILEHNSGINLVRVDIPQYPLSISSIWISAGSRYDLLGKEGLAHLFEHLLGAKTTTFPDRQKRNEAIEREGLTYNAITTKETQSYFYIHTVEKTRRALELLFDGIQNTLFTEQDIDEEKRVIQNEERRNYHDPASYIWRLADKGLWEKEELGKNLFGTHESLAAIRREDFLVFQEKMFSAERTTAVFVNPGMSDSELQSFALFPHYFSRKSAYPSSEDRNITTVKKHIIFEQRDTETLHLAASFLTNSVRDKKEQMVLAFIRDYLANGWMSRLVQKLRVEKKLTYWVSGETRDYLGSGYIRFSFSLSPSELTTALHIFEEEIQKLKTTLLSHETMKNFLSKQRTDILQLSVDPESLLWWYGWYSSLLRETPQAINEYLTALEKLQPADLQQVAQKYFTASRFSLALLGEEPNGEIIPDFQ